MILCVFMRIIISYKDRVTFIMLVDIILNKDCLTGLAELPSGSVDLVFADPPYNLQPVSYTHLTLPTTPYV